ncbi:hypothetical protein [Bradyrhizobium ivorense]|uniref:hypothetical protein n=1 Tax=Bradyrhizobium ivorense TaxID=2511166 RepID=UPI0011166953|nr:hypothetical protein [Bradyrhizobium ivorense]
MSLNWANAVPVLVIAAGLALVLVGLVGIMRRRRPEGRHAAQAKEDVSGSSEPPKFPNAKKRHKTARPAEKSPAKDLEARPGNEEEN